MGSPGTKHGEKRGRVELRGKRKKLQRLTMTSAAPNTDDKEVPNSILVSCAAGLVSQLDSQPLRGRDHIRVFFSLCLLKSLS